MQRTNAMVWERVVLMAIGLFCAASVDASDIAWGLPVPVDRFISKQVLNNGALVKASSIVGGTVNGVTFGTDLVALTTGSTGSGGTYGPQGTDYAILLKTGVYRASGSYATTTLSGLTIGQSYTIQVFTPYWDANYPTRIISGSHTVDMGNTKDVPTYVLGTFTASATSQSFSWTASPGSSYGLLGAFQVREGTDTAQAALISWETPVAVDKDNPKQVVSLGPLVQASSIVGGTVNGVTFANDLLALTTGYTSWAAGSNYGPNDTDYAKLLRSGVYKAAAGAYAATTISGLSVGKTYQIQIFTPFWNNNFPTRIISGSHTVDMGNSQDVPTYVVGRFKATVTSQEFYWTASPGSSYGLLGAFQVREIPPLGSMIAVH